ncbi:3'-5' exonuclease [Physcia stellaris]|nr:3'-5' exonuclease [Physcia stellaris]
MAISLVDSESSVASLIDSLKTLPSEPPSLYLDLEGIKLSRHGSISILQIFVLPMNHTYLLDVCTLGERAFSTSDTSGTNLRAILESQRIPKAFFDVRNDADALFAHFGISLQGVWDIQLMEVAARRSSKQFLNGLGKCIEHDAQLTAEAIKNWKASKEKGLALFDPERGGSYEIFNTRPLPDDIVTYCAQDVVHLPQLWNTYKKNLSEAWAAEVEKETQARLKRSKEASYDPHGKNKAFSPWPPSAATSSHWLF